MNITHNTSSFSDGHVFHPGKVVRWVSSDPDNVYLHTFGDGTGRFGWVNEHEAGVNYIWGG